MKCSFEGNRYSLRGNNYTTGGTWSRWSKPTVTENTTVLGSTEVTDNSLTIYGIERMKTGEVNVEGKIYLSRNRAGDRVKYALMTEGLISQVGEVGGKVVMNDVATMDTGKVLPNGYVYVGSEFVGEEATIAAKTVEAADPEDVEEPGENNQTAETPS